MPPQASPDASEPVFYFVQLKSILTNAALTHDGFNSAHILICFKISAPNKKDPASLCARVNGDYISTHWSCAVWAGMQIWLWVLGS